MSARNPESDLEMTIFPWTQCRGWDWPSYPCFKNDAEEQLNRVKNFESRAGDILLCTSPKSGTHWLHEIVCMLVDHTTEYNSRDATLNVHLDFTTDLTSLENEQKVRIVHSHFPYNFLPQKHKDLGSKIIYLNRNPKDRHVSQYCFTSRLRGFPAEFSWNHYFEEHIVNDKLYGGWWEYTRQYLDAMKTTKNIHGVTFEGLKLTPQKEIKKLAEFLDVPADDDFVKEVAEKVVFDKLRHVKVDATVALAKDGKSILFRKGQVGDWKNYFTIAQNEEFDAIYEKEMKGYNVEFVYDIS